jgi:hypothetical protein
MEQQSARRRSSEEQSRHQIAPQGTAGLESVQSWVWQGSSSTGWTWNLSREICREIQTASRVASIVMGLVEPSYALNSGRVTYQRTEVVPERMVDA